MQNLVLMQMTLIKSLGTMEQHQYLKQIFKLKQAELQTAYDNAEYQRKRAKEYPSMADQLDDIYHNGIDAWKATIKITKDKYPKDNS
jgi:hypothetical protein